MKPFLSLENLNKQFGQFTALNDISLTIEKGEFICFLGPSGCGKTTLLRMIAGLESCEQGQIWQNGANITHLPPEQRDFGIVFQSYALFPNLTVFQNIAIGLRQQRASKVAIEQQVNHWLETIGLPEIGDKFPGQLSGGQQQRVALARALILSPGLLLLDEPLSALDAKVRIHLRETIRSLQKQLGITTIMVTHDQEEAMAMADRIVVMNHGVVEQIGTPQAIYQQPASRFVAGFIGAMNFLDLAGEKKDSHILSVSAPRIFTSLPLRPAVPTACGFRCVSNAPNFRALCCGLSVSLLIAAAHFAPISLSIRSPQPI